MRQPGPKPCPPEFARPCQRSAEHEVLPSDRGLLVRPPARPEKHRKLTPIPSMNRQTKQRMRPGVPSTYVFATPNNATAGGVRHTAPTSAARRRSSATHFPARFLRHFLTMRSERRPAIGAPTDRVSGEMRMREVVRAVLTHVTNTSGYKTRPY